LTRTNKLRLAAVLLVLVPGTVAGVLYYRCCSLPPLQSADIFTSHPLHGYLLRPGLREARVVIPGRPHPMPFRFDSAEYQRKLTRRLVFHVTTNSAGFRWPQWSPEPAPATARVVAIGDSITFGWGVSRAQSYPAALQRLLDREGGRHEVLNLGVPGKNSAALVKMMPTLVLPLKPRVLIVCTGINNTQVDGRISEPGHPLYDMHPRHLAHLAGGRKADLRRLVTLAREAGVAVILMVPPWNSFYPFRDYEALSQAVRQVAKETGVATVDLQRLFDDQERREGLVLKTSGNLQQLVRYRGGRPETLLTARVRVDRAQYVSDKVYAYLDREPVSMELAIDGCHPSAAGHAFIARVVAREVVKVLALEPPVRGR